MSARAYKKAQEKEQRKYAKGENPADIDYKKVEIHYAEEKKEWDLIYNSNIVQLVGVIKF